MYEIRKILGSTDPVLVLFLGACPAVAMSESLVTALAIGLAALVIMLCSAVVMRLLDKGLDESDRLVASVLVTTFFASAVQMLMKAFLPGVFSMMGIYVAVLAVDLMVFSVAGNRVASIGDAIMSALLIGIYFLIAVMALAGVRVLFGSGMLFGFSIDILNTVPGGLVLFAIELAIINHIASRPRKKRGAHEEVGSC